MVGIKTTKFTQAVDIALMEMLFPYRKANMCAAQVVASGWLQGKLQCPMEVAAVTVFVCPW